MYKNIIDYCVFILYPAILLESSVALTVLGILYGVLHICSFPIWMPFISFPCLIALKDWKE